MNKIPKGIAQELSSIKKTEFRKKYIVIETETKKYLCRKKNDDIEDDLKRHHFQGYYYKEKQIEDYDLCEITKEKLPLIIEMKNLLKKTSQKEFYLKEEKEKIIVVLKNKYDKAMNYYLTKQDRIEEKPIPTKEEYTYMINASKIYQILSIGRFFLEEWEKNAQEKTNIFWIDDITKENIINEKIINIKNKKKDNFIYFLANYYIEYYQNEKIQETINTLYRDIIDNDLEYSLYLSLIIKAITEKKEDYFEKTYSYVLEEYKEYQNRKENMLKEE